MGVFQMPTVQEFIDNKFFFDPKKFPVWVYLEEEMLANLDKKPYNEKVGAWLKYLKELKYYQYCEGKKALERLQIEAGPAWFIELSSYQRFVLERIKPNIQQDLIEGLPNRIRQSLCDLGVTLKFPKKMLLGAMRESEQDAGIFIWCLYTAYFKMPPSQPKKTYCMNAMILMSSLVFIDLEECIDRLDKLVKLKKPPPPPSAKRIVFLSRSQRDPLYQIVAMAYIYKNLELYNYTVTILLEMKKNLKRQHSITNFDYEAKRVIRIYATITVFGNSWHRWRAGERQATKPRAAAGIQITNIINAKLKKRKDRNKKDKELERVCNYKFWEPPSNLRTSDPSMAAVAGKLKMLKLKAKQKYKAPYKNVQYQVAGVSFTGETPNYILQSVSVQPTGYIPINAGIVYIGKQFVTTLHGYWRFPKPVIYKCDDQCDCLKKWEKPVMEYLEESKCKCGHLYDYHLEGKVAEKYFEPPTRHAPFTIDQAKIFQMDGMEDFIKDTVREAVKSPASSEKSDPTIAASGLRLQDLLAAFLADLSDTHLLIPHLPDACLLNNLQQWVRKRVNGPLTPKEHNQMKLQSLRRWLELKHMDFRARAGMIPFTLSQLDHMDWSYRKQIQMLFLQLLEDFSIRNQLKQVEQARLWWSTMKYDAYPNVAFRDTYFTYMPSRLKDSFLVNPYSSELTPKYGAKTCPL